MNRFDRILTIPLFFFIAAVAGVLLALVTQVSPSELKEAVFHAETFYALKFSLGTSCCAMLIALAVGVSSAYFMARREFAGKGVIETILDLPLVMPPLIVGVGLLFLLGKDMLGAHLAKLGINFIFNPSGAVIAQAFIATPIVMRSAQAAFSSIDRGYEETAATLGLTPFEIFIRINLPLVKRSMFSAIIMAWARTMGEFGGTLMVAGATRFHTETLPIAVYLNISSGELGIAVSCALVLLCTAFVLLLAARIINRGRPHLSEANGESKWPLSG